MAQVLIRRLDDDIVARLRDKAKREGVSLEQFLRDVVTREAGPSREELFARLEKIRTESTADGPRAADLLREDRDRDSDYDRLYGL